MKSTLIIITFILLLLYSASRVDLTAMPYLSIVLGRELVSHGMKAVGYFSWTASDSYSVIFGALLNTKQYLLWEMTGLAGIVLLRITLGIIGLLVFYISLEQNFKLFTVKSSNTNQQFVKFIGTISYAILGVGLWGSSSELISLVALPLVFSFCSKSGVTKYLLLIFLGLSWVLLAGEVFNVFQWQAPDLHEYVILIFFVSLVIVLPLLLPGQIAKSSGLFFFGSLVLFLLSKDFQPLLVFSVSLVISIISCNFLDSTFGESVLGSKDTTYKMALIFTFCFLAVGLFAVHKDSKVSPVSELLPKLKALRSSKKELRIFNLLPDSSELAFNNVKVFMMSKSSEKSNSSTSPLKQTISDDYLTLSRLQEGWSEVLNHWKFDVALLPKDSSLANILVETNNWRVLAESSTSYKNFYGVKREATKVLVVPNNY